MTVRAPAHANLRPRAKTLVSAQSILPDKPPRKARHAGDCLVLEQLPNIGPSLAANLRLIGVQSPQDLCEADGVQLYQRLCQATGQRQDPCVLDTFLAITDFMRGAPAAPWWTYTAGRKQRHGEI